MLNTFLKTWERSKINYIAEFDVLSHSEFQQKPLYPILFDLLHFRFAIMLGLSYYRDELTSLGQYIYKSDKLKYQQVQNFDVEQVELGLLSIIAEGVPQEFELVKRLTNSKNILFDIQDIATKILLLHYANVFDTSYESLVSLLKQLESPTTAHKETLYRLTKAEKNAKLNFHDNQFKRLSLYV